MIPTELKVIRGGDIGFATARKMTDYECSTGRAGTGYKFAMSAFRQLAAEKETHSMSLKCQERKSSAGRARRDRSTANEEAFGQHRAAPNNEKPPNGSVSTN
jgi:hypothetical protein